MISLTLFLIRVREILIAWFWRNVYDVHNDFATQVKKIHLFVNYTDVRQVRK